ncbi:MAG TPA: hypothetical protein VNS33_07680 [Bradyrhizobium sp.]|jgi:hypothetical protein|nr:hypothetical protein [Bradyrhizobium sp.]
MCDLNREALLSLRDVRDRMTKCLPPIAEGVLALRTFPIDQLPAYIRVPALRTINEITDMAMSMESEVDEILLSYAKSDFIDPDENSEERAAAREEYTRAVHGFIESEGIPDLRRI